MEDMVSRGVAREITDEEMRSYTGPVHYLSHHEVWNENSISTPMRIVFNPSASFMGHVFQELIFQKSAEINTNSLI